MKKLVLLLVMVFSSGWVQSQDLYEIDLYNLTYRINRGVKNSTSSNINIEVVYSDGTRDGLYFRPIRNEGDAENNYRRPEPIITNKLPVRIDAFAFVNFRTGTDANGTIPANFSIPCVDSGSFSGFYSPRMTTIDFDYDIRPLFTVEQPSYRIQGFESPLTLTANTGIANNLYRWQYATSFREITLTFPINITIRIYNWADIPVTRRNSVTVTPQDFLPESVIGTDVFFRVTGNCSNSFGSNIISYRMAKSAPTIQWVSSTRPKCFDATDGTITIQFDRGLDANDNLSIAVGDMNREIGGVDENGRPNLQSVAVTGGNNITLDANNRIILTDVPPSTTRFRIDLVGSYNGQAYYTGDTGHFGFVTVGRNDPVAFRTLPKDNITDVFCHGGNDGSVTFTAEGGVGNYEYLIKEASAVWSNDWKPFTAGATTTIPGLLKGTYQIKIKDGNDCVAKIQGRDLDDNIVLGAEIEEEIIVEEPVSPVQVSFEESLTTNPTAFGFTNGVIVATVRGGTPDNGRYTFEWRNESNTVITTTDTRILLAPDTGFQITLRDIPKGEYYLTVWDKNHTAARFKTTCTVERAFKELFEPDQLILTIEESKPISCNSTNTNSDPFSDGELIAHAKGGITLQPFDNGGLPYYYTWKKQNKITNIWENLSITDSIASGLDDGLYAVNIQDANGIVIGEYINNVLDTEKDETKYLREPDLLELSYTKKDVFCFDGEDGSIDLTITGGTPFTEPGNTPYIVVWNNGEETEDIAGLLPDIYRVSVTDARGCTAFLAVEIEEPNPIEFDFVDSKDPSGFEFTDGWIKATVKEGTSLADGSYRFEWRDVDGTLLNGQVTTVVNRTEETFELTLNDIGEGLYFLTIWDANYDEATQKEGCTVANQRFGLQDPDPLEVMIEETNSISCNNTNIYNNPSSDGELVAHAKGGIRFSNGLPYKYTWKKQQVDASWLVLANQNDSIATNLDVGNYAVNIEDRNGIILAEYENNLVVRETDSIYDLKQPLLLEVSFNKQDAYCFAGSDGWAEAIPAGGTPPYSYVWNTGEDTPRIENLKAGTYEVIITDDRGCDVVDTIEIEEPDAPVSIDYPAYNRPSRIGADDSWIIAEITGGTPFDDQSYTYQWQNRNGELLNAQTETSIAANGAYQIRLNNITAGIYYLTVTDKNHQIATTKSGCTVVESEFVIHEPIETTLAVHTPISCNQDNEFLDPSSDGELVAHVRGGVPFPAGLPYRYTWKKQQVDGSWQVLTQQTDSIATGLDDGTYAFNAEDQLGTVMGRYQSDILIQAVDSTFVFVEPDLVQVSLSSVPISCDKGNDGSANVTITGGIPPYDIEWSNGATSQEINELIAGKYVVFVTDARGCRATGQVTIAQPGGLVLDVVTQKVPTCFEGDDGTIEMFVSGGTPPYTYIWEDGSDGLNRNILTAGIYRFQVQDNEGCTAFQEITLIDPDPVPIDLGGNRTICGDQSLELDVTINDQGATYFWESDNGFTSTTSFVSLSEEGVYKVTITTSLGCVVYDEVNVTVSDQEIDADFLLLSQAFTGNEVTMVNVSYPDGDKIEWTIPEDAGIEVISQDAERLVVVFDNPGTYTFNLRTYQGDCYQDYEKNIVVQEATELPDVGDARNPFIEEFLVYPNPTDGKFTVKVTLSETATIALRMFNLTDNRVEMEERKEGQSEYVIPVDMTAATGAYIMVLETPKGDAIRKIIFE